MRTDGTELRAWGRRIKRSKPGGPTTTQRDLRLFLTVFLVVFLGGLGVPGAQALWSQNATTVATIKTGTWWQSHTCPGPSLTATHRRGVQRDSNIPITVSWTPWNPGNNAGVMYDATIRNIGGGAAIFRNGQVQELTWATDVPTPNPGASQRYRLTITPSANGRTGTTTTCQFTVTGS